MLIAAVLKSAGAGLVPKWEWEALVIGLKYSCLQIPSSSWGLRPPGALQVGPTVMVARTWGRIRNNALSQTPNLKRKPLCQPQGVLGSELTSALRGWPGCSRTPPAPSHAGGVPVGESLP